MATISSKKKNQNTTNPLQVLLVFIFVIAMLALVLRDSDLSKESFHLAGGSSSFSSSSSSASSSSSTTTTTTSSYQTMDASTSSAFGPYNPLAIPPGEAENLPSERELDGGGGGGKAEQLRKRGNYGGEGDKKHLGGFTEIDVMGISPTVWKYMITNLGVHSLLDVGCGRGISTTWFHMHGCHVKCVEGSHDAVTKSMLPNVDEQVVEHDFSRGPWWPGETYDAVWAVEFLEHVGVQYHFNYITAFRKAALIFVSSSRWGGWHHVEVHQDDWWIRKYESYGFKYDKELTDIVRGLASSEREDKTMMAPNGEKLNPQHIWLTMKVFVNPMVAALPQHAHLFFEHGCFKERGGPKGIVNRPCAQGKGAEIETPLPPEYWPIELTPEMDEKWVEHVKQHIKT